MGKVNDEKGEHFFQTSEQFFPQIAE